MPKYWGKQIFAHGRIPEVGQDGEKKKRKRRKNGSTCQLAKLPLGVSP